MRIDHLRLIISNSIKILAQGKFEDLCRVLLPLIDPIYQNLERHGGTADGKTRKGTPDLLKTLDTGKQIAVQCSTEKDYWDLPEDQNKLSSSKPCRDIDACLKKLLNLQEIVLCSNQEIPTNIPNAKSLVIEYAKNKTKAKLTPINLVDIENFIIDKVNDISLLEVLKSFVPEAYEYLQTYLELQKSSLQKELSEQFSISEQLIQKLISEGFQIFPDQDKAKEYIIQKIHELPSRFETKPPYDEKAIKRNLPANHPLFKPIGIFQSLIGVPRIGKTALVAQVVELLSQSNIVYWFICPFDERQNKSFIDEFLKSIFSLFLPSEKAGDIISGAIPLHSIEDKELKYKLAKPAIFVVDNLEFLTENDLKLLCHFLVFIKNSLMASSLGIIFISNKPIKYICSAITQETTTNAWNERELKELIGLHFPKDSSRVEDNYIGHLLVLSGGHPLIALALAKENHSIKELILATFTSPSITDTDLAEGVKIFLFNNILGTDNDALNLVIRMSTLIYNAKEKVLNIFAKELVPPLSKPVGLILDKLLGAVIEGGPSQGYSLAYIYKKIAEKKITQAERKTIYKALANGLIDPKIKVKDANDVIEGINYAVFAEEYAVAFYWAFLLLQSISKKDIQKHQIKIILGRLFILTVFKPSSLDREIIPLYFIVLIQMAMVYSNIGEIEKSLEILERISPVETAKEEPWRSLLKIIIEATNLYKAVLHSVTDPAKSIKIISEMKFEEISKMFHDDILLLGLIKYLISKLPLQNIPPYCLKTIINAVNLESIDTLASLMTIATMFGVKAQQEKVSVDDALRMVDSDKSISQIMKNVLEAQYYLENKNPNLTLKVVSKAFDSIRETGLTQKTLELTLYTLEGDAYYNLTQYREAKASYLKAVVNGEKNQKILDYGWASYRLGLLSEKPEEAKEYFETASIVFNTLNLDELYARAQGEKAITFVQLKEYPKFLEIAEKICVEYFLKNNSSFAPVCAIILSHLTRFICLLENRPVPESEGMVWPEFNRGVYAKVFNSALPVAGGLLAFFSLASCYDLMREKEKKLSALNLALSFETKLQLEKNSIPIVIKDLLDDILSDCNVEEIKKLMIKAIYLDTLQINLPTGRDPKEYISHAIFSKLDQIIPDLDKDKLIRIMDVLSEIQRTISDKPCNDFGWWLAELGLRKARIGEVCYTEEDRKLYLWKEAYILAKTYFNKDVVVQAGHFLSFSYSKDVKTIKELVDMQFSVVEAFLIEKQGLGNIEIFSNNLFNFWRRADWRRLSEHDIKAKQTVMDGAKELASTGLNIERAAPVMILLIASLYDFRGDATNWAVELIKKSNTLPQLPKGIIEKIRFYF